MIDMTRHIEAKSDQLNADDLGPARRIIEITRVTENEGDQPISIYYKGGEGRPWKPSKGMRRCLTFIWGTNAEDYVGRAVEVYNDPSVTWGGAEVGGIRVSRASHISEPITFPLPISRTKRIPFTVHPLPAPQRKRTPEEMVDAYIGALADLKSLDDLLEYQTDERRLKWIEQLKEARPELHGRVVEAQSKRAAELSGPSDGGDPAKNDGEDDDQFPGGAE